MIPNSSTSFSSSSLSSSELSSSSVYLTSSSSSLSPSFSSSSFYFTAVVLALQTSSLSSTPSSLEHRSTTSAESISTFSQILFFVWIGFPASALVIFLVLYGTYHSFVISSLMATPNNLVVSSPDSSKMDSSISSEELSPFASFGGHQFYTQLFVDFCPGFTGGYLLNKLLGEGIIFIYGHTDYGLW